jgi:hypothetical protein
MKHTRAYCKNSSREFLKLSADFFGVSNLPPQSSPFVEFISQLTGPGNPCASSFLSTKRQIMKENTPKIMRVSQVGRTLSGKLFPMCVLLAVFTAWITIALTGCESLPEEAFTPPENSSDQTGDTESRASQLIPFTYTLIDGNAPSGLWQKTYGDLNGDGLEDIIVGGYYDGGLVWYENPTWQKRTISDAEGQSTDGEVADIDNDGDNDLVSLTAGEIIWYQNPEWTYHVIEERVLHDLELSDFDQDGDIDVVARNQGEFGHDGDRLFFYEQISPTNWQQSSLAIPNGEGLKTADVDADGLEDVIVNGKWYQNDGSLTAIDWSEHTFTTSWSHPNSFIAVGDINNDQRLDIAMAPAELEGQTYRISWFAAPEDPTSGSWEENIVVDNIETVHHYLGIADMNNDGHADLVTAEMMQGEDPDEVAIFINTGNGIGWSKQVLSTNGSHSMRLLDIENDGDIDLFGANFQDNDVEMWVNQSCQAPLSFWERQVIDGEREWTAVFITAADLNGDQFPDVITGGWWYANPGRSGQNWNKNLIGTPLNNMAVVFDFDQDGDMDILGTEGKGSDPNSNFVWAENDGSGSFTIHDNIEEATGDFLQGSVAGSFYSSQDREVILSWHLEGMGIQQLTIPANPATTTWNWSTIHTNSQDEDLSAGDIDKDGDLDILLGTKWLRNDNGTWSEHTLHQTNENPDRNELIDVNGDGSLDAIIGYEAISDRGLLAWYTQGPIVTDPWTQTVITDTIIGPMSIDAIDMDFDGDTDIVAGEHNLDDPGSARLLVFENENGVGTSWVTHLVYTGDEHHDGAQLVDIDLDGDYDIISIGWGHNQVNLYVNNAPFCGELSKVWIPIMVDQAN